MDVHTATGETLVWCGIPDIQEDVDPVENDVGHLRCESDVLQEVGSIGDGVFLCVVGHQFVVHKILGKNTLPVVDVVLYILQATLVGLRGYNTPYLGFMQLFKGTFFYKYFF